MLLSDGLPLVAAYLLGSVSFAVLVSRFYGLPDPRTFGSRNPGATNMLRSGNRPAAFWTLLGDTGKGLLAVWLADQWIGSAGTAQTPSDLLRSLVVLAAFLGHLYPVFFRFEGGKGVATGAGLLCMLGLPVGVGTALVWLSVFLFTRVSSMAALATAVAAPLLGLLTLHSRAEQFTIVALALLLVWRHRINIRKLLSGEELAFKRPD